MAIVPPIEALSRFQENEDRLNTFVNGGAGVQFVTSEGEVVPSLQKMLVEKSINADEVIAAKALDADTMISAKSTAADEAIAAKALDADNMISAKSAAADEMIADKVDEVDQAMANLLIVRDEAVAAGEQAVTSANNAETSAGVATAAADAAAQSAIDAAEAGGDMTKAVYDPTNVGADAFDRSNHHGAFEIAIEDITGLAAVAGTGQYADLVDKPTLGSAAAGDTTDFATAAQGAKADSAVQPADLGSAAIADAADFATAAQGAKADSAVQPGDIGSAAAAASTDFATAAQGTKADSAVQPDALSTAVANMAKTNLKQSFSGAQRSTIQPVTFGSTITIDVDLSNLFSITEAISSGFTLANFAHAAENIGLTGTIRFKIDATGGRHITMGSAFKPIGQTAQYDLPQGPNVVGYIDFQIWAADEIRYSITGVAAA